MYNLNELIKKNAVALFEAERLGRVKCVLTDKSLSKIRYFAVAAKTENEADLYFPFSSVSSLCFDALALKNKSRAVGRFSLPPSLTELPISASVYSHEGRLYGAVTQVEAEDNEILSFTAGELTFPPSAILSFSDELIIVNDSGKKVRLTPPPAPAIKAESVEDSIVYAGTSPSVLSPTAPEASEIQVEPTAPKRGSVTAVSKEIESGKEAGFSFLIGRTATKSLSLGEHKISEGEVITKEHLSHARSADKLVQLALHSR